MSANNFHSRNKAIKMLKKGKVVTGQEATALKQISAIFAVLQIFTGEKKGTPGKGKIIDIDFEEIK